MPTFDKAEVEVIFDFVGMKSPQNILHQQASSAAQLDDTEFLFDCVGHGVEEIDGWGLHEDCQPGTDHLSEKR
jgi:hypothetical protein